MKVNLHLLRGKHFSGTKATKSFRSSKQDHRALVIISMLQHCEFHEGLCAEPLCRGFENLPPINSKRILVAGLLVHLPECIRMSDFAGTLEHL